MPRYQNTKTKNVNNSVKQKYDTTFYLKVPERNDDMYFISQEGDRCDNLAYRFYDDPNLWWFIAKINGLKTMNVPAGISLRIPASAGDAKGF